MIYLDNAATTQIAPEVIEEMMPYLEKEYGNPGSLHKLGRNAALAVSKARKQVADSIEADPEQIIFTSGGSEANSLVFQGLRDYLSNIGKKTIIVSAVEHDSVLKAANSLTKDGFDVKILGVNRFGEADIGQLEKMISPEVGLVSVMYVNNETGAVNDVEKIGALCHHNNILFHTDCVQAAGCYCIDVRKINCNFASISSHKIHGPKGIGALYVKNKNVLSPLIYGGSEQEFGIRGGTENTAGIVGFGKACSMYDNMYLKIVSVYKKVFARIVEENLRVCGLNEIIKINGKSDSRGRILNIRFDGIDGETLVLYLDSEGIAVSSGSACCSKESTPSHVLTAMGLSSEDARNSIRISFSDYNSIAEIERAANAISDYVIDAVTVNSKD